MTASRAEATHICRLCRKPSVLQHSHVLPEWGYHPLYDKKHRMMVLRAGGTQPYATEPFCANLFLDPRFVSLEERERQSSPN